MIRPFLALALLSAAGPPALNLAEVWPEFRGPFGNGYSPARGLPLHWGEGRNVRWKTAIHGRGWSTPAVWGRQVWLTTASEDGRQMSVLCLDRETGRILLDRVLFRNANPEPLGNSVNSYASPSPLVDEGRVIVHFGSYGTACLDTRTFQTLWVRRDLPCRHYRGPASSPIAFEKSVILTFDGVDVQYLAALDRATGRTLWRADRTAEWNDLDARGLPQMEGDARKAHSTPIVIQVGGRPLLVSVGAKAAYGHDPRTGREVWKASFSGFSASLRPVAGHGLVFIPTGYSGQPFWALRPDGQGDVTRTHVAWTLTRGVPQKPSPVLVDGLLYLLGDSGVMTCVDAATGAVIWQERVGGQYSASPLHADGRIYCFSEGGRSVVLRPGRAFQVLAENSLEQGMMASPAAAGRALYLRTKTHLYRIEEPAAGGQETGRRARQ